MVTKIEHDPRNGNGLDFSNLWRLLADQTIFGTEKDGQPRSFLL